MQPMDLTDAEATVIQRMRTTATQRRAELEAFRRNRGKLRAELEQAYRDLRRLDFAARRLLQPEVQAWVGSLQEALKP